LIFNYALDKQFCILAFVSRRSRPVGEDFEDFAWLDSAFGANEWKLKAVNKFAAQNFIILWHSSWRFGGIIIVFLGNIIDAVIAGHWEEVVKSSS
jgi:hypothetical protein